MFSYPVADKTDAIAEGALVSSSAQPPQPQIIQPESINAKADDDDDDGSGTQRGDGDQNEKVVHELKNFTTLHVLKGRVHDPTPKQPADDFRTLEKAFEDFIEEEHPDVLAQLGPGKPTPMDAVAVLESKLSTLELRGECQDITGYVKSVFSPNVFI